MPQSLRFILLHLALLSSFFALAQNYENLIFDRITIDDGLINSRIRSISSDEIGRIWITTANGISVYDGVNMHNINRHNLDGGFTFMWDAMDDEKGNMVISTGNGVVIYNQKDGSFKHYAMTGSHPLDVFTISQKLHLDAEGSVWLGTSTGLCKLQIESDTVIYHHYLGKDENGAYKELLGNIYYMQDDKYGNLWAGDGDKLLIKKKGAKDFLPVANRPPGKHEGILINAQNEMILYGHDGVFYVEKSESTTGFDFIDFNQKITVENFKLTSALVLVQDNQGSYWLKTHLNHVYALVEASPNYWKAHEMESHQDKSYTLTEEYISCMYVDREGVVWMGTDRKGVNKCYLNKNKFNNYHLAVEPEPHSILGSRIFCLYSDDNELWLLPKDGPIHILDLETNELIRLPQNLVPQNIWNYTSITKDGNYLFITSEWSEAGLFRVTLPKDYRTNNNLDDYQTDRFFMSDGEVFDDSRGNSVLRDSRDRLWYICHSGLILLNDDGKGGYEIERIQGSAGERLGKVTSITEDFDGGFWIGIKDGLTWYDYDNQKMVRFDRTNTPGFAQGSGINSVFQTADFLWLAHGSTGIYKLDKKLKKIVANIGLAEGLPSDDIRSVVVDNNNEIWGATGLGLVKYNQDDGSMILFDKNDGLPSIEFTQGVAEVIDDHLIFGTLEGLTIMKPNELLEKETYKPRVFLTYLYLNDSLQTVNKEENSILKNTITSTDQIILDYRQNKLTIGFSSDSYSVPDDLVYQYRMVNFENTWKKTSASKAEASYTNLPPGDYQFQVKVQNIDGVENNNLTTLSIEVLAPWWSTWWFRGICISLILLLTYFLFRWRERKAKKRATRLARENQSRYGGSRSSK